MTIIIFPVNTFVIKNKKLYKLNLHGIITETFSRYLTRGYLVTYNKFLVKRNEICGNTGVVNIFMIVLYFIVENLPIS
jgi:hypothetical protein